MGIKVCLWAKRNKGCFYIFSAFVLLLLFALNYPICKTGPKQFFTVPASATVALQLKYWRRSCKVLLNKEDRTHSSLFTAFHPPVLRFANLAGMIFSELFHFCFDICFSNHIIKTTACLFHLLLAVNFIIWATILFYYCEYSENPCG